MASLVSGGPIEFLIPGSGDDYLDLANTMLHVQVKVTRANGDGLDLVDPVGPVNNWLHSLFSQVDVSLNGTLVIPSTNMYRAYIETLLSYGTDAKVTQQFSFPAKCIYFHLTRGKPHGTVDVISLTIQNISVVECVARITLKGMFKIPP